MVLLVSKVTQRVDQHCSWWVAKLKLHLELDATDSTLHLLIVEVLWRGSWLLIEAGEWREEVDEGDPAEACIEADDHVVDDCCFTGDGLKVYKDHLEKCVHKRTDKGCVDRGKANTKFVIAI